MLFQYFPDLVGKAAKLLGQGLQLEPCGGARNTGHESEIDAVKASPVRRHALLYPRRDHLRGVTPVKRDPLPSEGKRAAFSLRLLGQPFELGCARHKWRQVEAEGGLDLAPLPFPGIALAVRAIAADHQATVDQGGQVPP